MEVTRMNVRVLHVSEVSTEHPAAMGLPTRTVLRYYDCTGKLLAFSDAMADARLRDKLNEAVAAVTQTDQALEQVRKDVGVAKEQLEAAQKDKGQWVGRANFYYQLALRYRHWFAPADGQKGRACALCNQEHTGGEWWHPRNHTDDCPIPATVWE